MSDFFFSITRVTCAQILKSAGIDRCSSSTLDTLTDIYIRYMRLLAAKSLKAASLAGKNEVQVLDVALAMEQTKLIRPNSSLDFSEESDWTLQGWQEFIDFVEGPIVAEQQRISQMSVMNNTNENTKNNEPSQEMMETSELFGGIKEEAPKQEEPEEQVEKAERQDWLTRLVYKKIEAGHESKIQSSILGTRVVGSEVDIMH